VTDAEPEVASVLARWTAELLARTIATDEGRRAFLRPFGLKPEGLSGPDARVSYRASCAVWRALTDANADPLFGIHFAEALPDSAFGVVGYLALSSDTSLDALRAVAAYYRLIKNPAAMRVVERGEAVHVVDNPAPGLPPWPRHLAEAILFAYKAAHERWTGRPFVPSAVRLQHPAPAGGVADLVGRAFGAPVVFAAPSNELVLARAALLAPMLRRDPVLRRYVAAAADRLLEATPEHDDLIDAVEAAVVAGLPAGAVTIEQVARTLGVGVRTLQRRLREHSLTFHELVDRARRSAADRMLADPNLSLKEVAFLLGYADPRGFRRARKRWSRAAPGADRGAS
jgi:AraC-like DNA-binding protein